MTAAQTQTVADLADAHPAAAICAPLFRDFGGVKGFAGPIRTVKLFEDNSLLRSVLETPGEGAIIVVDGGGSLRCALFGGNLGALALKNGWAGVIIYGCVRDSVELAQQAIGIKALATHPLKSDKGLHGGQLDCPVTFADVTFVPGHWLYADEDGVLVLARPA
ncbi:MAG: ribonuclease E activity regulator RraA [Pseudomarimonas sp.]